MSETGDESPEERQRSRDFIISTLMDPDFLAEVDRIYGDGPGEGEYEWRGTYP